MKTPWTHRDFLLRTGTARTLYHEVAADLPVIDYHCHLDPAALANNGTFDNLAQLWVTADPYKHRAMRIAGVPEREITGDASDREKFDRWAATVPLTLGNPLHHWTGLELKRYFDIDAPLSPATADEVWARGNALLQQDSHRPRALMNQSRVEAICTSDRLLDDLESHRALKDGDTSFFVLPTLRGDDVLTLEPDWLARLTPDAGSFDRFQHAVTERLDAFHALGCRLADHGLDDAEYESVSEQEAGDLYERAVAGKPLDDAQRLRLRSGLFRWLATEYAKRGWLLQLHLGAQRRTSTRLRTEAGPAGGYAALGSPLCIDGLARLLDDIEQAGPLPRTILYNLNPADNQALATLTGSFCRGGMPGALQFGPAWWFNDHRSGMRSQLDALANYGLLATFIGMTTDSRSFLSMTRHEYFRRVFCDWVGEQVADGLMPDDTELLSDLVARVCHRNAHQYLFETEDPSHV